MGCAEEAAVEGREDVLEPALQDVVVLLDTLSIMAEVSLEGRPVDQGNPHPFFGGEFDGAGGFKPLAIKS